MNRDVGRAWVAALRSGEFTQGRHALATRLPGGSDVSADAPPRYGHCCLGVLCELALRAGVPLRVESHGDRLTYDGEINYVPEAVMSWAGLASHDPSVADDATDDGLTLSDVNDRLDSTFYQIADVIEAQLLDDGEETT